MSLYLMHFCGIALAVFLFKAGKSAFVRQGNIFLATFFYSGTILHELCHLVMVLMTFGRPVRVNLVPYQENYMDLFGNEKKIWVMGGVEYSSIGTFSALPIGMAPLILVGAGLYVYVHWFGWFGFSWASVLTLYPTLFWLIMNGIPSGQDVSVAVSNYSYVLWIPVAAIFYFAEFYEIIYTIREVIDGI